MPECFWNIFVVKRVKVGIVYSGYVTVKSDKYIFGRHEIQNSSDYLYYYLLTCVWIEIIIVSLLALLF